jgi:hypothetical protein
MKIIAAKKRYELFFVLFLALILISSHFHNGLSVDVAKPVPVALHGFWGESLHPYKSN